MVLSILMISATEAFAQKKKWQAAQEIHTVEAYRDFIDKHPKSEFKEEAQNQIAILQKAAMEEAWENTRKDNSVEAYKDFLKKYPKSDYQQQANSIVEEMEWARVSKSDSRNGYERFLKNYPKSTYASNAQEKLKNHTYKTTFFRPNGRVTVQGNEKGYLKLAVSKAFSVDRDKRDLTESLIGKPAGEEQTAEGWSKCTYPEISFWTNNEQYYWQDQGEYDKIWEQNTPRTLILYYDDNQIIKKIEVE